jgi:hypothetical protein
MMGVLAHLFTCSHMFSPSSNLQIVQIWKKFKSEICSSLKQLKKSKKTEWKNSEWNSENKRNTKRKTKETRTWRKPELSLNGPGPLPVDPERSPRYSSQWAMIRNGERRGRYAPPPPSTVWGIHGWTARLDACKGSAVLPPPQLLGTDRQPPCVPAS